MKKKATTKKRTAKKKVAGNRDNQPGSTQPPLDPEWQEQIPEDVASRVDDYLKAMRAHNKLSEKKRNAKEAAIESMKAHGIKRLRIDEGKQWLIVEDKQTLSTKKVNVEKDATQQAAVA